MSYDADILIWSEQQANLLRRMARGERVNGLDWENVAEEIESVGRSELHAVESHLIVALTHLLYLAYATDRKPIGHWATEVRAALGNARRRFGPSMAQRIDLGEIWDEVGDLAFSKLQEITAIANKVPEACPFTLGDLLAKKPDIDALVARILA